MNKQEMLKLVESQKGQPVTSRIFKHRTTGEYETQVDIMQLSHYDEVSQ